MELGGTLLKFFSFFLFLFSVVFKGSHHLRRGAVDNNCFVYELYHCTYIKSIILSYFRFCSEFKTNKTSCAIILFAVYRKNKTLGQFYLLIKSDIDGIKD